MVDIELPKHALVPEGLADILMASPLPPARFSRLRGSEAGWVRGFVLGLFGDSLLGCLAGRLAGWSAGWLAGWPAGNDLGTVGYKKTISGDRKPYI